MFIKLGETNYFYARFHRSRFRRGKDSGVDGRIILKWIF
jgi:hypothetical protein